MGSPRRVFVEGEGYHRALGVRTLGRRGLFPDKSQVARPLEMTGYQSLSGSLSQGISLALSFNYLDSSLFPKGCHYLQRTCSNYPRKQGNWDCSNIHRLNSQNENLSKARTKGSSRKHSLPLGKTQSSTYGVTIYVKLLLVSSHFLFMI